MKIKLELVFSETLFITPPDWKNTFLAQSAEDPQNDASKPSCSICQKQFFSKQTLKRHMSTHNEARPLYNCDMCSKSYTYETGLAEHKRNHREEGGSVSCPFCQKLFRTSQYLSRHVRANHSNMKKRFSRINSLIRDVDFVE